MSESASGLRESALIRVGAAAGGLRRRALRRSMVSGAQQSCARAPRMAPSARARPGERTETAQVDPAGHCAAPHCGAHCCASLGRLRTSRIIAGVLIALYALTTLLMSLRGVVAHPCNGASVPHPHLRRASLRRSLQPASVARRARRCNAPRRASRAPPGPRAPQRAKHNMKNSAPL